MFHRLILTALTLAAPQLAVADQLDLGAIEETLGEVVQAELDKGIASISLALVKDGEVVLTKAWGHSNVWARTPATPETIYCTGSTFKAVTATAILQLAEQDLLSLDDPANLHLGEHRLAGDEKDEVTVGDLLDHTSGLQVGAATQGIWERKLPATLEEIPGRMTWVKEPGEEYQYNNHAYAVAGLIIEKVSGQTYEDYIVQHILRPLGVTTPAPIHPTPGMVERMALPYVPGPDQKPRPVSFVHFDVFPAGDVYLTPEDMARFLAAHLCGGVFGGSRILSEESVKAAHQPHLNNYALGWGVNDKDGILSIAHGGGVPGTQTFMIGEVDTTGDKPRSVGAYIMSNAGNMAAVGSAAIELLWGRVEENR